MDISEVALQPTKPQFEGTHTLVTFPYSKATGKNPSETAQLIGEYLKENSEIVQDFNVVKGFLNLSITDAVWLESFEEARQDTNFGRFPAVQQKVMVEFSSPNTNKPLHLGHLRNILLGHSVSLILEANGYEVVKANLVNDRGIHICKSMVAYRTFGQGVTPESAGIKGDHLAGKYYVEFDKALKKEAAALSEYLRELPLDSPDREAILKPLKPEDREKAEKIIQKLGEEPEETAVKSLQSALSKLLQDHTSLMQEARSLLEKWEAADPEIIALWKQMNGWVYEGFDETYQKIGVSFDKIYYESQTYLLGKDIIEEGLAKEVFYRKDDSSVWIDLTTDKLDEKLLLRSNGTSVYMTQDLGTADLKYQDYEVDKSVYVVGNEQDYHFKVLFKILEKMGRSYAPGLFHLSYGMVDLPSGKMKSREGTVVDADDLVGDMVWIAKERTDELGKTADFREDELQVLYRMIALGALKYFLLRVDPKKRMLFNPEESVDFKGDAGPFIQFNHARISAILRTAQEKGLDWKAENYTDYTTLKPEEGKLLRQILAYPRKVQEAGQVYAPSIVAQYCYDLASDYGTFYSNCSIFQAESESAGLFRVALSEMTARVIKQGMALLGVEVPVRM